MPLSTNRMPMTTSSVRMADMEALLSGSTHGNRLEPQPTPHELEVTQNNPATNNSPTEPNNEERVASHAGSLDDCGCRAPGGCRRSAGASSARSAENHEAHERGSRVERLERARCVSHRDGGDLA